MTTDDELVTSVNNLRLSLTSAVDSWRAEQTKIDKEQKKSWNWIKGSIGFVAFDVVITFIGLYMGINVIRVSNENDALINQLQRQNMAISLVVNQNRVYIQQSCNLYSFVINGYGDIARARFAGGTSAYNNFIIDIQNGADALKCGIPNKL
jgi:hypothetical protein